MEVLSFIETPFKEKFGVPRQSLLIEEAIGKMRFPKNDFFVEAFRGIENFSHLWLIFEFHLISTNDVKALVRPPRYEGKTKFGVFATRSPHRPNRLGLSVVKFESLLFEGNEVVLTVRGVDLVDKTPIYDVKPYIPYVDSLTEAKALDFDQAPSLAKVIWRVEAPAEKILIEKVIGLDPRPGQDKNSDEEYGVSVAGWNVRFKKENNDFVILKLIKDLP
jgi:tRNA-Thr(GGU) m(6)t(6)A37 methyltransferase TsaA